MGTTGDDDQNNSEVDISSIELPSEVFSKLEATVNTHVHFVVYDKSDFFQVITAVL